MNDAPHKPASRFRTGVVMDPIAGIKTWKDSTFAMLLEAQRRGHELWYMEPGNLTVRDGIPFGHMRPLSVRDARADWFTLGAGDNRELAGLDFLLMRRDPPFDMDYVYCTHPGPCGTRRRHRGQPPAGSARCQRMLHHPVPAMPVPALITRHAAKSGIRSGAGPVGRQAAGRHGRRFHFPTPASDPNLNVILEAMTATGSW
jgi:glutathione synthase